MSITLEIPEALYKRLQKHAVPFVDTPLSVIEKWADHFEHGKNGKTASIAESPTVEYGAKKLDPLHPPDLFHTRARGTLGATRFSNWNDLVRIAHIAAFKQAGSFEELRNVTLAQIDKGERADSGYKFVPDIGISIQGVDANHAWPYALRLAKFVKQPLHAAIEWRHNAKAAHPGSTGVLEFVP
ncbi:MAG: hypothetical protein V7609_1338 [Verrucomicrobiota bacterium]